MSVAISVSMTEAGVAALERVNRTRQSPQAVAAAVFNAMEGARRREAAKTTTKPEAYVHQGWPAFRYGPEGERQIFQRPEDVPDGWQDSPDFVTAAKEIGAETVADLPSGRRPGRPRKEAA
jgi:hypothetical protein